jgi:hypothetical protein
VDALAWELESLGVELAAGVSWDAASVGITVHADRLDAALALLAEIVRRPAFPEDQVERLRDERLADILQRRKEPRALASDAADRFIYRDGMSPTAGRSSAWSPRSGTSPPVTWPPSTGNATAAARPPSSSPGAVDRWSGPGPQPSSTSATGAGTAGRAAVRGGAPGR